MPLDCLRRIEHVFTHCPVGSRQRSHNPAKANKTPAAAPGNKEQGFVEKRIFYTGEGLGNISQIRLGWPADREGSDIAAVGSRGADFLDSNGQVRKQVRFAITGKIPVAVARIDPTGAFGYLTRDESWAVPVTLFDKEGHVAWSSNAFWAAGVDDSVPGDVYGDGKLSVVVRVQRWRGNRSLGRARQDPVEEGRE
jgi:hypothetical protein